MATLGAAAILGGSSLLGGIAGGKGASKAAKAQAQAQQAQLQLEQNEFNTISGLATPTVQAGDKSTQSILDLLGIGSNGAAGQQSAISGLQSSPLFTGEYNQGLDAINQSAAATGGLRGGNNALNESNFGANLLSSVYQNQLSNLFNVSGLGASALGTLSGAGSSFVNASGQTNTALGNANATSAAAPYAALQQIIGGIGSAAGSYYGSGTSGSSLESYFPTLQSNVLSGLTASNNAFKF